MLTLNHKRYHKLTRGGQHILPYERKQRLTSYLAKQKTASITELSRFTGVSEMTVRRDLAELQQEGIVKRTHGGAVYVQQLAGESDFESKQDIMAEQKEKLAAYAAQTFVQDDAVVFLEGGTTVTKVSRYLNHYTGLTLVTNGLITAAALRPLSRNNTVLCCGGMIRELSMTLVGSESEQYFAQFHAHYAFLSAQGLTAKHGFTDPNLQESQVKRAMSASAQRTIMLIDSSKWGICSTLTTFPLNAVDVVVTDTAAPAEMRTALEQAGAELHIV